VPGPAIDCKPLPAFDDADLHEVRRAFWTATPIPMQQAWLPAPDPAFTPATVRTGWRGDALLVFAELDDEDIFTAATDHNQAFWELGDTFEIFLRPADQQGYVELHVAPNNLHLHLWFPDAGFLARTPPADVFGLALRPPEAFTSRVWVDEAAGRWSVLAEVPAAVACGHPRVLAGSEWQFSFSRYDFARGRKEAVISSTSPHAAPSFHRQQEWGRLRIMS